MQQIKRNIPTVMPYIEDAIQILYKPTLKQDYTKPIQYPTKMTKQGKKMIQITNC